MKVTKKEKQLLSVNEVSLLTGISVRALHYYDTIGLLSPSAYSNAGYRLYGGDSLVTLQQILFFRELDVSLADIKKIIQDPKNNRQTILQNQRKMLVAKQHRLQRLIASIDSALQGDSSMDFGVFSKSTIEELYEVIKKDFSQSNISIPAKEVFVEKASKEDVQKVFKKMTEWNKTSKIAEAYQKRIASIYAKLHEEMTAQRAVTEFDTKAVIGELDFIIKQYLQLDDASQVLLSLVQSARSQNLDKQYGAGFSSYFEDAVNGFLKK